MTSKRKSNGGIAISNNSSTIFQLATVQRSGRADNSRPRIQFSGDWLTELGFVNSALIQALSEPNGFVFTLCNENINYSELYQATKQQGGSLIRMYICTDGSRYKVPSFVTTGKHIFKSGLTMGDNLIAKCEYGLIRVRKVSGNVRLTYVSRTKHRHTNNPEPMIFLLGNWLNDIGFTSDTLVTVSADSDSITFKAHNKAIVYSEIVKLARQHKMQLMQVSTKDGAPLITLTGNRVAAAGFNLGDVFAAEYEHGIIKLRKLDPNEFGFPEDKIPEAALS